MRWGAGLNQLPAELSRSDKGKRTSLKAPLCVFAPGGFPRLPCVVSPHPRLRRAGVPGRKINFAAPPDSLRSPSNRELAKLTEGLFPCSVVPAVGTRAGILRNRQPLVGLKPSLQRFAPSSAPPGWGSGTQNKFCCPFRFAPLTLQPGTGEAD